jgi:glycosyltransferase involved in cell wall biosynthesis
MKPVNIILGAGGFPYQKTASSNKFFLMGKALSELGFRVILINKVNSTNEIIERRGQIESVEYLFLSTQERNSILKKIITKIKANFLLFSQLRNLRSKTQKNFLIISRNSLSIVIYYRLISWILGYRLIFIIMEFNPVITKSVFKKIKSFLFWNFAFFFADGALPISHFIHKLINKKNKSLPLHILPVLADFNSNIDKIFKDTECYFCYCGSIGYEDVIKLIIDAFNKINNNKIKLYLIISGKNEAIEKFKNEVKLVSNIIFFQNLTNTELFNIFSNSIGLLIPMRPCIQDKARFPQKIAEYVASGSPIITNSVGEISYYFNNNNAILTKYYTVEAYFNAMQWVIENPEKAKEIGKKGKETGYINFHYKNIANQYAAFLNSI